MKTFLEKYTDCIHGVIHGFDRIILKGYISDLYYGNNFYYFLKKEGVLLKDFKPYALKVTEQIKKHVVQIISEAGAYSEYLNSPNLHYS